MFINDPFNFPSRDILASATKTVLLAPKVKEKAVLIGKSEVARVKPPVSDRVLGCLGIAVVAFRQHPRFQRSGTDLARLAGTADLGFIVDDFESEIVYRSADRA